MWRRVKCWITLLVTVGDSSASPPATVTTEVAKTESWIERMHAIGTLVAMEGVDVAPQVAGIVTDYFFESGNDVEKGAKLVKLDTSVEEADLADNKATLVQANLDFDRQRNLVDKGAVSQATLDQTVAKRDSALAEVQPRSLLVQESAGWQVTSGETSLRRRFVRWATCWSSASRVC